MGVILALARLFSSEKVPQDGYGFQELLIPAAVLLLPMAITIVQPDLGTAICQGLIGGVMILLAGVKGRTLLRLGSLGVVLAIPGWSFLHDYQKKRILNFLSPEMDPLGSGYHAIQSMIAVGSGSEAGKGFLQGTQTQLRFLPEQTTDFLFSVLAEEWGFIGSALVIALYAFLVFRLIQIGSRAADRFSAFVCMGTAALVFWQVVINIGMVTGSLPVVGITLPLLSYGGSSVVTIMASLGLAAGTSARRFKFASGG
jgi:rod shape determining protein RodA